MSLADLFTAIRGYEDEVQQLTSQKDNCNLKVADLQSQLLTAALQHGNDQQVIANLQNAIAVAQQDEATLKAELAKVQAKFDADETQIVALMKELAQLSSTVTYPDLEWAQFALNLKPDAASGRGTSTFTPADTGKPALFSITPDDPLPGDKDNWFNVFATRKLKPNTAYTNFTLRGKWEFPTDADMRAAHCIEMEARQVRKLLTPDPLPNPLPIELPLMCVPALQANFSSGQLRYFNALAPGDNWIPTGIAMPRQRTVAVVMEAHRDDKTLYYDAFTINGQRHAVSFQAPLYAKTYVNERLSVSLQLDSHYLGGAFKVIPSGVSLEVR